MNKIKYCMSRYDFNELSRLTKRVNVILARMIPMEVDENER